MTPEQALNTLFSASRRAALWADDHDACRLAYEILVEKLKPRVKKAKKQTKDNKDADNGGRNTA